MSESETGGSERYEGWSDEQIFEELKADLIRAGNCLHDTVTENAVYAIRDAKRLAEEAERRQLHTESDSP